MSDVDRLRAAADRLDGSAEEFTAVTTQSKATAALLRAVADDHDYDDHVAWRSTHDAALALADTILETSDE